MRLEARKYLTDIQAAAERIARFTGGKRFEQYLADEMLRSAVERQFGILGEALSRLSKDSPEIAALIPDHARMDGALAELSSPHTSSTRLAALKRSPGFA